MDLTEKTISAEQIFQGKVFSVHVDEVSLPDSKTACREVVDHPGGVCIAAEDARGRLLFVRQYRYPCKRVMLELPAGKLEPGEYPLQAAKRELREETGARSEHFVYLGKVFGSPGFCNEVIHLYYTKIESIGETQFDEGEFLTTEAISAEEAIHMAAEGRIEDGKTIAALMRLLPLR